MAQRHGSLQSLTGGPGSVNSAPSEYLMANYISGMQLYGRMSAVRRFFCLFCTFDFLFSLLFWIICVIISCPVGQKDGSSAYVTTLECFKNETLVLDPLDLIQHHVFDIVITSFCRFLVLIILYAAIHLNHVWPVAVSTALSSVFLLAKTLFYQYQESALSDGSHPFVVMLVLSSFFLAWTEAWFMDFRVLPQESRARAIVEAASSAERENDPLLPNIERVRDYLSQHSESVANFYSPKESPAASDDEDEPIFRGNRLTSLEEELRTAGKDSFQKAWATINSSDWKLEKKTSHGDLVHSKPGTKTPKIYRLTSEVDVAPEILFKEIYYNLENLPTWNSAITHSKLLQKVDASTDVCYQVAAEGPGGVVTARDFVNVRHWEKVGDCWVSSGVSVPHPDMPPQKKMVRGENGPGCWVFGPVANNPNKCTFKWLLDTDLKGWIPQYVLDQALTHAMIEYINSIRKYTPTILRKYTLEQQQQDDS
ncbi:steroidogenic acute regulatory protein-like [Oratosquilla oratoria]|uniref:steroidogenic acute regulatory protein-like n=1 Tax=Oratosquilla oratoria TaxID=337810 RepID=UPI003F759545